MSLCEKELISGFELKMELMNGFLIKKELMSGLKFKLELMSGLKCQNSNLEKIFSIFLFKYPALSRNPSAAKVYTTHRSIMMMILAKNF